MLEEGLEIDEELEENIDQALEQEEPEEDAAEEALVEIPSASSGEDEYLDKEIRENSEEEYTWEEFLDNNEGHASQSYYDSRTTGKFPPRHCGPCASACSNRFSSYISTNGSAYWPRPSHGIWMTTGICAPNSGNWFTT